MDELVAFTKYVGIFFMALTAFIGVLFTLFSFSIFRSNHSEILTAKNELRDWVQEQGADVNKYWERNSRNIDRVIEHKMNISLLEYSIESGLIDADRVYILLSRVRNTVYRGDIPLLKRLESYDFDDDTMGLLSDLISEASKYTEV